MNYLVLGLILLGFISCNDLKDEVHPGVETVRKFEPLAISADDYSRLTSICNALQRKYDMLHILYGSTYNFDYSEKSCTSQSLGPSQKLQATVDLDRSDYVFRSISRPFPFPVIETPVSGIMRELCEQGQLTNPRKISSGSVIWYSTQPDSVRCRADADHQCLMIERGSLKNGTDFSIHTREWLRFRIREGRRGFVTQRWLQSRADCPQGLFIERELILR
jgi:hypothetical protein